MTLLWSRTSRCEVALIVRGDLRSHFGMAHLLRALLAVIEPLFDDIMEWTYTTIPSSQPTRFLIPPNR